MLLKQKRPGLATEYELLDDKIVVRRRIGTSYEDSHYDYSWLRPDPARRAGSDRRLLVAAFFAGLFSILLFMATSGIKEGESVAVVLIFAIGIFGLSSFLVWRFFTGRYDLNFYFYRNGEFAFAISREKPDTVSFQDFSAELATRIKKVWGDIASHQGPGEGGLASELEQMGRLRDKGLLTEEEFNRAKAALLDKLSKPARGVGFHEI